MPGRYRFPRPSRRLRPTRLEPRERQQKLESHDLPVNRRPVAAGSARGCQQRHGFPQITSHILLKSVATAMDEAWLTARNAADQLGHARPSITQDVYFGRGVADTGAAQVLESLGF